MISRGATDRERGVSAVLIALSMMLVLGFAAVAIDLGFGFNERRQDQTAADLGVMAGAVNYVDPSSSPTNENIVTDVFGLRPGEPRCHIHRSGMADDVAIVHRP